MSSPIAFRQFDEDDKREQMATPLNDDLIKTGKATSLTVWERR